MKIKVTVKEAVEKLKEKNPSPRRMYNKNELTSLVEAILNDNEYVAKNTKIKQGEFVTEDRHLSAEFKKALAEILKQLGLNGSEALAALEEYKVPKSLAASIIDVVHHADHVYMNEVGKGIKFFGESDVDQTFFARDYEERTRSSNVPGKTDDQGKPITKITKVKAHRKIAVKSRYNPKIKDLLN